MERSTRGTAEVVGIAAAAAAALGGIIVALSRAQGDDETARIPSLDTAPISRAASSGIERGRDTTRSAIETLADAYPEIRENARQLLSRLGESAKPAADRAVTSLPSADTVRATGVSVLDRLQETVHETVIPVAGDALHAIRERVEEGRERAEPPAGIFAATGATAQRAVDRSSRAAQTAVTTSKNAVQETFAAAAWMTIGGSLLYFVLLSDEQRAKVKAAVAAVIEQVQLLVQDFQGYEDEF